MGSLVVSAICLTFQVYYGFVDCQRAREFSRLSMDLLVVSAIHPTFQVENGFADSQRGPSNFPG